MSEVWIRPMKEADLKEIAAIEKEAIIPPWSERDFRDSLELSHVSMLVAILYGQIAGYCVCYQSLDEGEITNVAVKKELRRQGIAGKLLEKLFYVGAERGIERFLLEVRASNEAALRTYEKAGFQRTGLRKNFYTQPAEDAVIMIRG